MIPGQIEAKLFGRSTIVDKEKSITGDSLYYKKDGESTGYGNVVFVDKKNKNSLTCNYLRYNREDRYRICYPQSCCHGFLQEGYLVDAFRYHAHLYLPYQYRLRLP